MQPQEGAIALLWDIYSNTILLELAHPSVNKAVSSYCFYFVVDVSLSSSSDLFVQPNRNNSSSGISNNKAMLFSAFVAFYCVCVFFLYHQSIDQLLVLLLKVQIKCQSMRDCLL